MIRAGIDIGGTFTDLVAWDGERMAVAKVPTTPDDPARGLLEALRAVGGAAEEVLHGTTVATNAVIERRGGRVGLVTTEGFRHLLHLARQDRPSLYDLRARRPEPLVPLERCVGVPERVGPDGTVLHPLDEARARGALAMLAGGVDAVAVCLLHAYANDAHERRVGELASEVLGVEVSLSSEVLAEFREYERASTTVMNAYVQPVMSRYLRRLGEALEGVRLAVMWSGGGLRGVEESARRPVHTVLSGPAAGVLGGAWVARRLGLGRVVTLDMGGTSADVALVLDGRPAVAEESSVGGLPFRTPCIDVVSVGAGGGSVAWVDSGGALRVGPRSAGAVPGPACYGRGGEEPTVTDAHLVCGHLGPEGLAGGALGLDWAAAAKAVSSLPVARAAEGILRVVRATMARAIRSVSVERGIDVRRCALVAFGGAGGLHACALACELGMGRVVVPPFPGALAALGLLVARRRADASRTRLMEATEANDAQLRRLLEELAGQAAGELAAEGVRAAEVTVGVDCRYRGQSHELRIPVHAGTFAAVAADFHAAHRARYGFSRPEATVEAVTFRATALGPEVDLSLPPPPARRRPSAREVREVEGRAAPVYAREDLPAAFVLRGPAVISSADATVWVEPGWRAVVEEGGALVLEAAG